MKLTIYSDGGCSNNQDVKKRQGYGSFLIIRENAEKEFQTFKFGNITNNDAEYFALNETLNHIINMKEEFDEIEVNVDSQLLIGHLTKNWKVDKKFKEICNEVKSKMIKIKNLKLNQISGVQMKVILGH